MIEELDVVTIKHSLITEDVDGDEISLPAGSQGTVMVSKIGAPICLVEFGNKPENTTMVNVNKHDLQLVWSYREHFPHKSAS